MVKLLSVPTRASLFATTAILAKRHCIPLDLVKLVQALDGSIKKVRLASFWADVSFTDGSKVKLNLFNGDVEQDGVDQLQLLVEGVGK